MIVFYDFLANNTQTHKCKHEIVKDIEYEIVKDIEHM